MELITVADQICDDYMNDDLTLTLRQLYYQFVSRDIIPNNLKSYKRLASIINDARLAGLIDWEAIEDRTRGVKINYGWNSPQDIISSSAGQYQINLWEEQPCYVEVWVEKDALIGVIERACATRRVAYLSCRGYTSQSELYRAARRFRREEGKDCHLIYLGDHDPSGIDMTRDVIDRHNLFGATVDVDRIALNRDQVDKYQPPPNPAKLTDSRAAGYIAEHGNESWELDALEPKVLVKLIESKIEKLINKSQWERDLTRELAEKGELESIAAHYDEIKEHL